MRTEIYLDPYVHIRNKMPIYGHSKKDALFVFIFPLKPFRPGRPESSVLTDGCILTIIDHDCVESALLTSERGARANKKTQASRPGFFLRYRC